MVFYKGVTGDGRMSKLFKLKKWLLLKDAAQYLSVTMSEPVQEADILQLALDGRITISINVVQPIYGKRANVVSRANVRRTQGIPIKGQPVYEVILGVKVDENRFLDFNNAYVQSLEGVFDLPMIGGEGIFVKEAFHNITNGVNVDLINIDGVFLQEPPTDQFGVGDYFQVVDYLDRKLNWSDMEWYPLGNLPDGVVLVVRTSALVEFLKSIKEEQIKVDKPLATRERDTLLKLVIGMAIKGYNYDPLALKNTATKEVADDLADLGLDVTDDTIRKFFKQATNTVMPGSAKKPL